MLTRESVHLEGGQTWQRQWNGRRLRVVVNYWMGDHVQVLTEDVKLRWMKKDTLTRLYRPLEDT